MGQPLAQWARLWLVSKPRPPAVSESILEAMTSKCGKGITSNTSFGTREHLPWCVSTSPQIHYDGRWIATIHVSLVQTKWHSVCGGRSSERNIRSRPGERGSPLPHAPFVGATCGRPMWHACDRAVGPSAARPYRLTPRSQPPFLPLTRAAGQSKICIFRHQHASFLRVWR